MVNGRFLLLAVIFAGSLACSKTPTQLVVSVSTDSVIDSLFVDTRDADRALSSDEGVVPGPLPLSFGVQPPQGDASRRVRIEIHGLTGSQIKLRSVHVVPFVANESRQFNVFLSAACEGVACPDDQTCNAGKCAPQVVSVDDLVDPDPPSSRDAGTAPDGGPKKPDAGTGCVPDPEPDLPDPMFLDTNCDGIDGDAANAIFVSPTGAPGAAGTISEPVSSITEAISLATSGQSIYVALGTYRESVVVSRAMGIYGGYDAVAGWARRAEKPLIQGRAPAIAVEAGVSVQLDLLEIHGVAGVSPSESAIALWAGASGSVELRDVAITAFDGADGAPGETGAFGAFGVDGDPGVDGCRDCDDLGEGGAGGATRCNVPAGGMGGRGGIDSVDGDPGMSVGAAIGGAGGESATACWLCDFSCPSGRLVLAYEGVFGAAGVSGRAGDQGLGAIDGVGMPQPGFQWLSESGSMGSAGTHGTSGAGGGGGGGGSARCNCGRCDSDRGGGGGGGGGAGCGGGGGLGGHGGGASIGIVSEGAQLGFQLVTIRSQRGGAGGDGGAGGVGGTAGIGGLAGFIPDVGHDDQDSAPGGNGGDGGHGGSGGGGGGGAGGASLCIWAPGVATMPDGVECLFGVGGRGGLGGLDGDQLQRAGTGIEGVSRALSGT